MKNLFMILIAMVALASCRPTEDKKAENDRMGMKTDSVASCCAAKDMKFKDFPTLFELLDQLADKKVTVKGRSLPSTTKRTCNIS